MRVHDTPIAVLLAETSEPPASDELIWAARYAHSLGDHVLAVRLSGIALAQRARWAKRKAAAAAQGAPVGAKTRKKR